MSTNSVPSSPTSLVNRKLVVQILILGFVAASMGTRAWDDLVSHVALGIAIGLGIATFIFTPPRRIARRDPSAPFSSRKTIIFWLMLIAAAVLIYQTIRGPR